MKLLVAFLCLCLLAFSQERKTILFSGLQADELVEYTKTYSSKLKKVWGANPQITFVTESLVEKIKHRNKSDVVYPNPETNHYLERYGVDSVILVVPEVVHYSVEPRRKFGVKGAAISEASGKLIIRYSFYEMGSGQEISTDVIQSDTTMTLGVTMLRPVYKSTTVSAADKDAVTVELIQKNIRDSYPVVQHLLFSNSN